MVLLVPLVKLNVLGRSTTVETSHRYLFQLTVSSLFPMLITNHLLTRDHASSMTQDTERHE